MKAIIYARCSTDEKKQDVEVQLKELRRYCSAYGWEYDERSEYGSGYKEDNQPELDKVLELIRLKHYNTLIVFSMDRFSREHPKKINALLDKIVYVYKCRFIALQQGIDSDNEMTWHCIRPLFAYFANKYSRDLGEKIKKGIANKKDKGKYNGGRPTKTVDVEDIIAQRANGASLRAITRQVNEGKSKKQRVSFQTINRLLQKHTEYSRCEKVLIHAVPKTGVNVTRN